MESPLTSQILNALTVRSWVTLLENASLLNIRQTESNGSKEKRMVPIEDSNSKALVAKDSQ
ncbi:hypothetical protein Tco_1347944, partial [Tanacetum coccineum]